MSETDAGLPSRWIRSLQRALLSFYDEARRDLPWRRTTDPYRIWVSEVVLQQTRAETVIPFYERWLARFPTLAALAAAPTDQVLKAWEGLGYYSRARNLHRAAHLVRERHAGYVPDDVRALRALPGVGEYTAGAVASIAFGRAEPAVDGNVRRVLARLLDEPDPSARRLRSIAAALLPQERPGDFNQAMMELGAVRCTPRAPACRRCPVSRLCRARRAGTQLERPVRRRRAAVPIYDLGTAVIRDAAGRLLLERRPDGGLLAGLFSFPSAVMDPGEAAEAAARRAVTVRLERHATPLGVVEHTFTHRRERYHAVLFECSHNHDIRGRSLTGGKVTPVAEPHRWVRPTELADIPVPVAQRKILRLAFAQTSKVGLPSPPGPGPRRDARA